MKCYLVKIQTRGQRCKIVSYGLTVWVEKWPSGEGYLVIMHTGTVTGTSINFKTEQSKQLITVRRYMH